MRRCVFRKLPDGSARSVQPFHVSMEGLENAILCRCDEDYDAMVKILCVCARRKNVIIIVYAVVSNHSHIAVLAARQEDAHAFGQECKRMYAMWFSRRYGEQRIMQKTDVKAISLDSDWYVRNALAYILRNALDNGCNVNEYPWSGYRAMFNPASLGQGQGRPVAALTKDECRRLMHTGDSLKDVKWRLDAGSRLIPASFCDCEYLEQAFEHDQSFFLKAIGGQNPAEMRSKLVEAPRTMLVDGDFHKSVNEVSLRWYQQELADLSIDRKIRLVPYLWRTRKTTVPQLARTLGLRRQQISDILHIACGKRRGRIS